MRLTPVYEAGHGIVPGANVWAAASVSAPTGARPGHDAGVVRDPRSDSLSAVRSTAGLSAGRRRRRELGLLLTVRRAEQNRRILAGGRAHGSRS